MFPCRLNILVLGGDAGFVELYAYGMYKIATLTRVRLFHSFVELSGIKFTLILVTDETLAGKI